MQCIHTIARNTHRTRNTLRDGQHCCQQNCEPRRENQSETDLRRKTTIECVTRSPHSVATAADPNFGLLEGDNPAEDPYYAKCAGLEWSFVPGYHVRPFLGGSGWHKRQFNVARFDPPWVLFNFLEIWATAGLFGTKVIYSVLDTGGDLVTCTG